MLTPVQGKILVPSTGKKNKSEAKKAQGLLETKAKKASTKPAAKNKAQAKPKASSKGPAVEEPDKTLDMVSLESDGSLTTRCKYFLDCMIQGIRSAVKSARSAHGLPIGAKLCNPDLDEEEVKVMHLCRHGLLQA